jgi:threonine dehydratase
MTRFAPASDPLDPDGLLSATLIRRAAERLAAILPPTPVKAAPAREAWLKLENLQVTGAYKVRGAFNAIAAQVERGDRGPVFAASAGNHGLGVAWAARHFGLPATIVVPRGAPRRKVIGCQRLGAQVREEGTSFDAALAAARALAEAAGARVLHAFDDPEVIAGQATVALELLALEPDVVLVPIGGGGLVAGMGSVLRRAGVRVVGVQVAGAEAFRQVLAGEDPRPAGPTLADGLRVAAPGQLTRRIGAAALDEIVVVAEAEVAAAIASLALDDKVVAEGAGAASVAALPRVGGRRRVAVVSGGNIDAEVLSRVTGEARAHVAVDGWGAGA